MANTPTNSENLVTDALWRMLNADAALATKVTGIFHDRAPEGQDYDYLTIGGTTSLPWDRQAQYGMEHTVVFHAWTNSFDSFKAKEIGADIYRILHDQELAEPSLTTVILKFESSDVFKDPDEYVMHGVFRYRVVVD